MGLLSADLWGKVDGRFVTSGTEAGQSSLLGGERQSLRRPYVKVQVSKLLESA